MNRYLHIESVATEKLLPFAKNARVHSGEQIAQIARSIEQFGFINPIIVDGSHSIVAGHGRLLAARQLDLRRVPVIRVEHLSEAQVRAYRLADNRIAEKADWDRGLLRVELSELAAIELEFDVELTGFSTPEIDVLLSANPDDLTEEPEPLPVSDSPVTQLGDIWCLGPHRLICGDARHRDVVDRLMQGRVARMAFTDPPYNLPIQGHVSGLGTTRHSEFAMASGELSSEAFAEFLREALGSLARVTMDGGLHYVCMDWRHLPELHAAGQSVYSGQLNLCVWTKTNGGMGSLYRSQHELIGVFKVGRAPHINNVELGRYGRYRTNVWQYAGMNTFSAERAKALALHPTVKPVRLVADAILDVTQRGDLVLDGFMGSGTTILAAEQVGRVAYGIEIDRGYIDVAIRRWQIMTGENAHLDGPGDTFEVVAADRLPSGDREAAL